MKVPTTLSLTPETAAALRERAVGAGVGLSDLGELLIKLGLARMSDAALAEWAAGREPTRGRLAGGMPYAGRAVLAAMDALLRTGGGAWRFEASEIAAEAGLLKKEAYLALKALQRRGLVEGVDGKELDRWGRPVSSVWKKA